MSAAVVAYLEAKNLASRTPYDPLFDPPDALLCRDGAEAVPADAVGLCPKPRTLDHAACFAHVTLTIYDLLGRAVATPLRRRLSPGEHALAWRPDGLPTGVYLYRHNTDDISATKTLVLLR